MIDFDDIILTNSEIKALKRIHKAHKLDYSLIDKETLYSLMNYNLISYNYLQDTDCIGSSIQDGTVSTNKNYELYRKYLMNKFVETKLPIIISLIALIKSFDSEIISVLRLLMQLLK